MTRIAGACFATAALCTVAACGGGGGGSGGGFGTSSVTAASVSTVPGPTLSFTADADTVNSGASVSLSWSSQDADSCSAAGGWSGPRSVSGTATVGPLTQTTSFSLDCSGGGGSVSRQLTVVVEAVKELEISLSVDRDLVSENDEVTITWSAPGAERCVASGGWQGERTASGDFVTSPLGESTTFSLSCEAGNASAVAMVAVEVADLTLAWAAPTENVDGTALTDLQGFFVYWGDASREYIGKLRLEASAREWQIDLPAGDYHFALTAVDSEGDESAYSNEVRRRVP